MKECNGTTGGVYVDRGPRQVGSGYKPADARADVRRVIMQGQDFPRPLTALETAIALENQVRADEDLRIAEQQWKAENVAP